jgi:hypothetical protein
MEALIDQIASPVLWVQCVKTRSSAQAEPQRFDSG